MDLYDVVFEGKLLPGKNINTVKADFAKLFKILSQDKVNSLFSGHPVVLKKSIPLDKAETYEHALLKIGAYCHHVPVVVEQSVGALEFEFTPVEQLQDEADVEAVDQAEEVASAPVDEITAIEFEYTTPEVQAQVAEAPLAAEPDEQDAPSVEISALSDMSLMPIEEQQGDEGEKA